MAFFFGTNPSVAAFLVALRLSNLLRRIFGEGALLNSFIPYFESIRNKNPRQAAEFFRDTFFSLSLILIFLIGAIEISIYFSSLIFEISVENLQILKLIMIILPGVLFICLFSLCSGLLQCEKNFFLTGVSPIAFNAIWIASVWLLRNFIPEKAVIGLSLGITLAFFSQFSLVFPKTVSILRAHLSRKEFFKLSLFSPEIRKMLSSLSLAIIGVTAAQINTALDTIFARFASLEGPAYLNYAIHLQQLPLALFGIGISSALLPPLSRAFKSDHLQQYNRLLEFSLSLALFMILPCTIAIFTLGGSSINLIFGRGQFGMDSTVHTIFCLWGYGIGLIPMAITLILAPAFYAKKDYRTPMIASLLSILLNLFLNIVLVFGFHLGPESLALSTSISAVCNALLLYRQLSFKAGIQLSSSFFYSVLNTTLCAAFAGIATLSIGYYLLDDPTILLIFGREAYFARNFASQIIQFTGLFFIFSTCFIFSAIGFKNKQMTDLFKLARRQKIS